MPAPKPDTLDVEPTPGRDPPPLPARASEGRREVAETADLLRAGGPGAEHGDASTAQPRRTIGDALAPAASAPRAGPMSGLYNKAAFLFDRRRYDLAERELRRAIAEDPGHAPSRALLGICLAHLGRGNEAIAVAQEAIRLDPGLAFAHYARARVQLRLRGRRGLGRAKKDVTEAIRLDVGRSDFIFLLAAILSDQGRAKLSLEQAELGLRLDPEHTGCASLRALALQRLGRGHEAEAVINSALALDPEDDFTHSAQGWRLMQRGDPRRAAGHFREALRINPENRWAECGLKMTRQLAFRTFRGRDLLKALAVSMVILLIAVSLGGATLPISTRAVVVIIIASQVGLAVAVCAALDRLRGR